MATLLLPLGRLGAGPSLELRPENVVVLANASDAGSLHVANHYAEVRRVPRGNIVALPFTTSETIDWRTFVREVWQPVLERLIADRWIDAVAMDLVDDVGRRKYAVDSHRIGALVICRGVPLRIGDDQSLYRENLPYTRRREFRTNEGSVDGELALLPQPNHPINAFVPNPLFQNERPTPNQEQLVIRVSRLDGPTVEDASALVDHAVEAEQTGLLGRAYIDLSNYDPVGDRWFEAAAAQLVEQGFDTDVDRAPEIMPTEARFDAPVIYLGWYTNDIAGACKLPGLRFPPGAIALHLHSHSAASLRSDSTGWTAPLVARGVTATVGNVYEPYLGFTHRPNLLVRALARGDTWVEAGYFALQGLSWQQVLLGDPLYRPFRRTVDQQLAELGKLPAAFAGYAVVRKANLLDRAHRNDEAMTLLQERLRTSPTPEVALALASRLGAAQGAGTIEQSVFTRIPSFRPDQWGLARSVALQLSDNRHAAAAVAVWSTLLKDLSPGIKARWLADAIKAAHAAGDEDRAATWEAQRRALVP